MGCCFCDVVGITRGTRDQLHVEFRRRIDSLGCRVQLGSVAVSHLQEARTVSGARGRSQLDGFRRDVGPSLGAGCVAVTVRIC